ncbi:MAG: N4-gp56 family major capsid protein, partial [Clostridia bacterium]|nr:N4-gp56 family major capsid protein [Clostridia bacterium]
GVRDLKKMNAQKINGYYVAIINQDTAYDLMSDAEWKYPHQYVDTKNIYDGEIGAIAGCRFVETSEGKIFAGAGSGGRDVYATLLIGDNAYGVTELAGGGLEMIVKQLGSAGTADPLNQRATAGFKATHGAAILSDEYMVRLETASTFNDGEAN